MDVAGVRIVANPNAAALALSFIGGGIVLGTASGLVPGLHLTSTPP